jgi:pre-mRNA-splicing factor CDC5/CEF1
MTPRDQKLQQNSIKQQLRSGFASLPKPKEIELEEPEEPEEDTDTPAGSQPVEDREEIDRRNRERAEAEATAELKRRTQVIQKSLPRPRIVDIGALLEAGMSNERNSIQKMISQEMATLIGTDALRYPVKGGKVTGAPKPLEKLDDDLLEKARMEIVLELSPEIVERAKPGVEGAWLRIHSSPNLPGLEDYRAGDEDNQIKTYDFIQEKLTKDATQGNKLEKKLSLHLGGYQARSKMLCQKLIEASEAIAETRRDLEGFRTLKISEAAALPKRLEGLRKEVAFLDKREREAQEVYRTRKEELESL